MKVLSRKLFLAVLTVALVSSSISFAEEQIGVKIENGVISFLGADVPSVNIKDLKFSFPTNSPEEILAIKGKIYGGKSKTGRGDDRRTIYLIPLSYDSETKKIKILYITNNYGTSTKINPEKTPQEGIYNGLLEGASLGRFATFYILKPTGTHKEHRIRLRFYGADGDFPPVAELPISAPAPKKEQEKIKIENGIISFPEADAPSVNIKDLKFSFSSDSPAEILAVRGKIYGWRSSRTDQATYLIPLEYDSGTKSIKLLYVSDNKGTQYKPTQFTAGGVYNGSEGSAVKPVNDKSDKPWARFYILPEKQNSKLRLAWQTGGDADFLPVAELPPLTTK